MRCRVRVCVRVSMRPWPEDAGGPDTVTFALVYPCAPSWGAGGKRAGPQPAPSASRQARIILEKATKVSFKQVDDLASVWCECGELELRRENYDEALRLLRVNTRPGSGWAAGCAGPGWAAGCAGPRGRGGPRGRTQDAPKPPHGRWLPAESHRAARPPC